MSLRMAARNVRRRKTRNVLTIMAILLGTALLVGVNIASTSALTAFKQYQSRFWGDTDIIVRYAGGARPFDQANVTALSQTQGVQKCAARLYWSALVNNDSRKIVTIDGIDLGKDIDYPNYNITGSSSVQSTDVVVGSKAAQDYGIQIGQKLNITTEAYGTRTLNRTYELSVIGIYYPLPPITSIEIFTDLATVQNMSGLQGEISTIFVNVADSSKTAEIRDSLQQKLGIEFDVLAPKVEAEQRISGQLQGFQLGLNVMIMVALLVCGFLVFNTMFMSVKERTYEIGVLRAVGTSRRQVFLVFLQESIVLGVIGTVIGIFAGLLLSNLLALILEQAFRPVQITGMVLTPDAVVLGLIGGFLTVVGGAVYPSVSASRVNILHALRPEMRVKRRVPDLALLIVGLAMFVVGVGSGLRLLPFSIPYVDLFLVPLGLVMSLAVAVRKGSGVLMKPVTWASNSVGVVLSKNVRRKLLRNAVSFGMIGLSLTFVILMGGVQVGMGSAMENGVREALGSDVILISNQTLPVDGFRANLTAMPQVESVTPLNSYWRGTKVFNSEANQLNVAVLVVDPATFNNVIHYEFVGSPTPEEVYQKLSSSNETLILPDTLAQRLNVAVGGNLTVLTATSGPKNFSVAGEFTGTALQMISFGNRPMSESIVISFKSEAAYFLGSNEAVLFFVNLKSDYKQQAPQYVQDVAGVYPAYGFATNSLTLQRLLAQVKTQVDQTFSIFSLMLYFTVLISTLGIAIITIVNVTERRREIGLFRSQGMSRRQILGILLTEAVFLGLIGFLIGLPSGLILLKSVTSTTMAMGFLLPFMIPWTAILEAFFFAIVASLAGALYPALKASRMSITKALQQR